MDPLRNLVVELDYVISPGGPVIATTVGYLGYVGVLTGVRPGLSMSLNYRPHHDTSTFSKRLSFRWNQLLVILGFRPSISSTLRSFLLPLSPSPANSPTPSSAQPSHHPPSVQNLPSISSILIHLSTSPSTAAYLLFTTPSEIYSLQKDNRSAHLSTSTHFLAACNHDLSDERDPSVLEWMANGVEPETVKEWLVQDSLVRKDIVREAWEEGRREEVTGNGEGRRGKGKTEKSGGLGSRNEGVKEDKVEWVLSGVEKVVGLVTTEEVSNEMTHYAVVMDAEEGKVMWRRVYDVGELGAEEESEDEDEALVEGGVEDLEVQEEPPRSLRQKLVGYLGW